MNDNYNKAYEEILEILKYMPKESVNKIPNQMIYTFKTKMDKNYNFSIDINKSFEEQNLLDETKAILANIFRDYWATPYQKERIEAKERYDRQKLEKEKLEKYNPEHIFKTKEDSAKKIKNNSNLPVDAKKQKFYEKLIKFFKKLFSI